MFVAIKEISCIKNSFEQYWQVNRFSLLCSLAMRFFNSETLHYALILCVFAYDFYWWKFVCKCCRVNFQGCEFSYDETRCHGCWKILNTQYICMTSLQNELRDGMILCFCCIICSTRAAFDLFFLRLVSLLLMIFQCVQATENL